MFPEIAAEYTQARGIFGAAHISAEQVCLIKWYVKSRLLGKLEFHDFTGFAIGDGAGDAVIQADAMIDMHRQHTLLEVAIVPQGILYMVINMLVTAQSRLAPEQLPVAEKNQALLRKKQAGRQRNTPDADRQLAGLLIIRQQLAQSRFLAFGCTAGHQAVSALLPAHQIAAQLLPAPQPRLRAQLRQRITEQFLEADDIK